MVMPRRSQNHCPNFNSILKNENMFRKKEAWTIKFQKNENNFSTKTNSFLIYESPQIDRKTQSIHGLNQQLKIHFH